MIKRASALCCAALFELNGRGMRRMQRCFRFKAQCSSTTARVGRTSTVKLCVMGICCEARQALTGVIWVDAVDLKSITDCSVITGLYKVELFILHSEKCQDSCYQSCQVKSQLLGQTCKANSKTNVEYSWKCWP